MTTAKSIHRRTMSNMEKLVPRYRVKPDMFQAIANQSGVSKAMVIKCYYGQRNPGIETLDKLTAAVDILLKRKGA